MSKLGDEDDLMLRLLEAKPDLMLRMIEIAYKKKRDKGLVLFGLYCCCLDGQSIPAWLAEAFCAGYYRYTADEVKSLDDVFGSRKLAASFRRLEKRGRVTRRVRELHEAGVSLTKDGVFAAIHEEKFGVSPSLAEKLYYESQAFLRRLKKL